MGNKCLPKSRRNYELHLELVIKLHLRDKCTKLIWKIEKPSILLKMAKSPPNFPTWIIPIQNVWSSSQMALTNISPNCFHVYYLLIPFIGLHIILLPFLRSRGEHRTLNFYFRNKFTRISINMSVAQTGKGITTHHVIQRKAKVEIKIKYYCIKKVLDSLSCKHLGFADHFNKKWLKYVDKLYH